MDTSDKPTTVFDTEVDCNATKSYRLPGICVVPISVFVPLLLLTALGCTPPDCPIMPLCVDASDELTTVSDTGVDCKRCVVSEICVKPLASKDAGW